MDKAEHEINRLIDILNVNEQEEGYAIHLFVALISTLLYFLLKNL